MLLKVLEIYVIIVNVFSFIVIYLDKRKARKREWRIKETTLFLLAGIGGSIGVWLGMISFRHKTLHKQFKFGVPAIILSQIGLIIIGILIN